MITTRRGKRNDADDSHSVDACVRDFRSGARQYARQDMGHGATEPIDEQVGFCQPRQVVGVKHAAIIGIGLLLPLLLMPFVGCDSPQDHNGADERAHVMAGHRVAGGGL